MFSIALQSQHKVNYQLRNRFGYVCSHVLLLELFILSYVAEDMIGDSAELLICLCRFIARQGRPKQILLDNVKHFKTASKVLDDLWKEYDKNNQ